MMRPWDKYYTSELERKEGAYSDYAAWERWMAERVDGSEFQSVFEGMSTLERIGLYALMADVACCADFPTVVASQN